MTYKFPDGSVLGTSLNFGFFNMDRVATVPITDGGSAFLNWCSISTDNYAGCGVGANGYFLRRAFGSTIDSRNRYHLRFNYSPLDNNSFLTLSAGTAFVKVYHADALTWMMMPEVVPPPPGVLGTDGEWPALLDYNLGTVANYQLQARHLHSSSRVRNRELRRYRKFFAQPRKEVRAQEARIFSHSTTRAITHFK